MKFIQDGFNITYELIQCNTIYQGYVIEAHGPFRACKQLKSGSQRS